uniref:Uncharacterized protein n=1 Tax=Serinus canaria TaxID=9135 RepID=A0A8C9U9M5_SERCA
PGGMCGCGTGDMGEWWPWHVGVRPKRVQSPTDMSRELSTVTTAARARPHLDFTMSILPAKQPHWVSRDSRREGHTDRDRRTQRGHLPGQVGQGQFCSQLTPVPALHRGGKDQTEMWPERAKPTSSEHDLTDNG